MVDAGAQGAVGTTPGGGRQQTTSSARGGGAAPWVMLVMGTMLLFDVVSLAWIGVVAPLAAVAVAVDR